MSAVPRRLPRARRSPRDLDAVRNVIDAARVYRARLSPFSPDRAYLMGVETAAEQVLNPGIEATRQVPWLDLVHPYFIAGYVETAAALAPYWGWSSTS